MMKKTILITLSILFGMDVYAQEIKDTHEERIRIAKKIINLLEHRDSLNLLPYFNSFYDSYDISPEEKVENRLRVYDKIKKDKMVFDFNDTSLDIISFDNQVFYYRFRVYLANSITKSSLIITFKITKSGCIQPWDFVFNYVPNSEASKIPELPLSIP